MHELSDIGGLEDLVTFVVVVEAGSFAGAARRLQRDASIVSRRIGQLEKRLGIRLIARTTRQLSLTEAGKVYHNKIRGLLEGLESASREASDFAATPKGLLRISLPLTFGRCWIAPLFPAFLKRYPDIRIDARFSDRFVDIIEDGFDVAIRIGNLRDSSLTSRKIGSYHNVLVASPDYLRVHGTPKKPDDLAQHACLGFTSHVFWPEWPLYTGDTPQVVRPTGQLIADDSEALLQACINGCGIMLTPDWLSGPFLQKRELTEVLPGTASKMRGGIFAVMPPGRLVAAKTRAFVDEITARIQLK